MARRNHARTKRLTMAIAGLCPIRLMVRNGSGRSPHLLDLRPLPGAVRNARPSTICADVAGSRRVRRGQSVALLPPARRLRAGVVRQRAVGVALQVPVLGTQRKAVQRVGMEQVLFIVERQYPEAADRRLLT